MQFWFCERTKFVQPAQPDAFPRFHKWDLTKLKTALKKKEVQYIEARDVRTSSINAKKVETICISVPSVNLRVSQVGHGSTSSTNKAGTHSSRHYISNLQCPDSSDQLVELAANKATHSAATSNPKSWDPLTPILLSTSAKGKSKLDADIPDLSNMTASTPLHMPSPYAGEHVADLKLKLTNALSTAEHWRLQHLNAIDKTKGLEETIEALAADNTALQASIHILELEKDHLQQQLSSMVGPSSTTATAKFIPNSTTSNTPYKGKKQVHFFEPSFDLGFGQNTSPPNQCRTITCYEGPTPAHHIAQLPRVPIQTRSHQPIVSPPPPSAQSKLAKNYKQFHPFRDLLTIHQAKIEVLAAHTDLQGYDIIWTLHIICLPTLLPNYFPLIQGYCMVVRRQKNQDHA